MTVSDISSADVRAVIDRLPAATAVLIGRPGRYVLTPALRRRPPATARLASTFLGRLVSAFSSAGAAGAPPSGLSDETTGGGEGAVVSVSTVTSAGRGGVVPQPGRGGAGPEPGRSAEARTATTVGALTAADASGRTVSEPTVAGAGESGRTISTSASVAATPASESGEAAAATALAFLDDEPHDAGPVAATAAAPSKPAWGVDDRRTADEPAAPSAPKPVPATGHLPAPGRPPASEPVATPGPMAGSATGAPATETVALSATSPTSAAATPLPPAPGPAAPASPIAPTPASTTSASDAETPVSATSGAAAPASTTPVEPMPGVTAPATPAPTSPTPGEAAPLSPVPATPGETAPATPTPTTPADPGEAAPISPAPVGPALDAGDLPSGEALGAELAAELAAQAPPPPATQAAPRRPDSGEWRGVVLITGTDTEVGKTIVTAAVAAAAQASGLRVAVIKPGQTGIVTGAPTDIDVITRLAGPDTVRTLAEYPEPMAPLAAATVASMAPLELHEVVDAIRAEADKHDLVLVEGAGGLLVPMGVRPSGEAWTVADLATTLGVRTIVVARPGLGTLNHTALTLEALSRRGVPAGVVIGAWPAEPELVHWANLSELVPHLIGALPEGAGRMDPGVFRRSAPGWLTPALYGVIDNWRVWAEETGEGHH